MRVQPEQVEDTDDSKHPEYHHAAEEKERQDRQQLNNTVCRCNKPEDCHSPFQKDEKAQAWYYRSIVDLTERLSDTSAWLEYKTLTEMVFGKGE